MGIKGTIQPKSIKIDESIRLIRPEKDQWAKAIPWYHNPQVMYYSEGVVDKVYEKAEIDKMYQYLSSIGELYFIEIFENNEWNAIGDVALSSENLPIVLGEEKYWGKGIGKKVVKYLLKRARKIGIEKINITIYTYNKCSQNLFKSMGFVEVGKNKNKILFEITLKAEDQIIDLSHLINQKLPHFPGDQKLPHFPGDQKFKLKKIKDLNMDKYNDYLIQTNMHAGTHIDSPMHLTDSNLFISDYNLNQLILKGIVIDASNQKIIEYKEEYEEIIEPETCLLIYTGHDKNFYEEKYYEDYPILSEKLGNLLIDKKIKLLGLDTPSPDKLPYKLHKKLLQNNIFIIENLTNLERLINQSFEIYAIPLKIEADSSLARVFAKLI